VQQQSNMLATWQILTRVLLPRDLVWTDFGSTKILRQFAKSQMR